jgi:hypothetical protein
MGQTTKRTLFALMVMVLLLPACASAPAATQDPAIMEQLSEQSTMLTSVAQTAQVQDQLLTEQAIALSAAMATPFPSQAPVAETEAPPTAPDSSSSESGNVEIPSGPGLETSEPGKVEIPTGSEAPAPTAENGENQGEEKEIDEDFDLSCKPLLETQLSTGDIEKINKFESRMADGKKSTITFPYEVTIKFPVNLRTRPSLVSRILLVLKTDTKVDIIDGPRITYYQNGTYYVWWKVKFGESTGWAVEMSACRQFYFMEPSSSQQ